MASLSVLKDGAPVEALTNTPAVRYGFAIAKAPDKINYRPATLTQFLQWQDEGVNLGDTNVRVVNFTANPTTFRVTRGTGERSNVITVTKLP
jgi:hypothetical protein